MNKLILGFALVGLLAGSSIASAQDVVPADEAFKASHIVNSEKFLVNFRVADGYQLYRDSLKLSGGVSAELKHIPQGTKAFDEFKGEVFYLDGSFQVTGDFDSVEGDRFYIEYQGCKPNVFCYPPQKHEIILP